MAVSFGYTTAQEGRAMGNHEDIAQAAEHGKLKLDVVSYIDYLFADKYLATKWYSKDYTNHYRIGDAALDQMIRTMTPVAEKYGNEGRINVLIHV